MVSSNGQMKSRILEAVAEAAGLGVAEDLVAHLMLDLILYVLSASGQGILPRTAPDSVRVVNSFMYQSCPILSDTM